MSNAVYGIFERMAYYGISSNLFVYLTKKLHQGTVTSSNNVTNWIGTIFITPILGAYIADAHLGRYWTFVISALIYLLVCLSITFKLCICYITLYKFKLHYNVCMLVVRNLIYNVYRKILVRRGNQ
jgi:dipeptide/tripeptide permease